MSQVMADPVHLLAERLLAMGFDEIPARERRLIERIAKRLAVSTDVVQAYETHLTFGQRLADKVASFGGSWTFIIGFGAVVALWMMVNSAALDLIGLRLDPYPFIFLNLILSLLAAVQAPLIMMSQNRLSARDRIQATHDYEVNLKAEIEIMALHEKLDELRNKDMVELLARMERLLESGSLSSRS
jgi:uncharacterized membrane protein